MAGRRTELLERIADALGRIAPAEPAPPDWLAAPAYVWTGAGARPIASIEAPRLEQLRGIDRQKAAVSANVARLASGHTAHDILLWGARGMGKSALIRAAVREVQESASASLALVQVGNDALGSLARLFADLAEAERNFLVYIDDLGFGDDSAAEARRLRSWLDGGVEARPANVRLAVTSNRRAIVERQASDQDSALNPRDIIDDQLALADRFGLSLGFHACTQDEYLAIVRGYAESYALDVTDDEALAWAKQRGARSGRTAWQFVTELAGRAGKPL